jgi:DNA-directed RNA polymerase specialized sigma24 family protein
LNGSRGVHGAQPQPSVPDRPDGPEGGGPLPEPDGGVERWAREALSERDGVGFDAVQARPPGRGHERRLAALDAGVARFMPRDRQRHRAGRAAMTAAVAPQRSLVDEVLTEHLRVTDARRWPFSGLCSADLEDAAGDAILAIYRRVVRGKPFTDAGHVRAYFHTRFDGACKDRLNSASFRALQRPQATRGDAASRDRRERAGLDLELAHPTRRLTAGQAHRVDDEVELRDRWRQVQELLWALPDTERGVLARVVFQDRRLADIANELGLSHDETKHVAARGARRLRAAMALVAVGGWCDEVRPTIDAHLAGKASHREGQLARHHLANCQRCRRDATTRHRRATGKRRRTAS